MAKAIRGRGPLAAPMADYTMPLRGHGIITAERLLYQSYGQGDSRARPAAAPMADYTMPLRGHGIITAERLLYQSYGQGDTWARPAYTPMANYNIILSEKMKERCMHEEKLKTEN